MSLKVTFVLGDFAHSGVPYNGSFAHGIASMTSVLKQAGHSVELIHLTKAPGKQQFTEQMKTTNPDLVAFSTITHMFPYVKDWAAWVKECMDVPIIVGGVHAILKPEEVIGTHDVDYVCTGEGEHALLELVQALEADNDTTSIRGLWAKRDGIIRNPQRPLIGDLNSLPLPDYSVFDYDRINAGRSKKVVSVMLSRGCPYRCSYCANQRIKNSYPNAKEYTRYYSVARAIQMLKILKKQYPETQEIIFNDNIIYPNRDWLEEFAVAYSETIALPFTANTRPHLTDESIVALLKAAGCQRVCMGVESGDEQIANRVLRRGQNNQTIRKAFRWFSKQGIQTVSYNIVGSPQETTETMLKTIRLNADIKPTIISPFIYYPFPGTESYDLCKDEGFLTERHGVHNTHMVMINQPGVSESQVLFFHRYFRPLVRMFQKLDSLPFGTGRPLEAVISKTLNSGMIPYGFLARLKETYGEFRLSWAERRVRQQT